MPQKISISRHITISICQYVDKSTFEPGFIKILNGGLYSIPPKIPVIWPPYIPRVGLKALLRRYFT